MSPRFAPIATPRSSTWHSAPSPRAAWVPSTFWPADCTRSKRSVRQILGYQDHLPIPFRAILGLIPNIALAGLSLWFVKYWNDRRLAAHCHYIGLPLSIAACIWSGFEPLAAVICLSLYAIAYLLAIWIFAVPWVTYLAASAFAGACYFGTTLVPGITLADQGLVAALLGLAFWAARVELRRRHLAPAYHVPWLHAGLALTGAAMLAANSHLVTVGVGSWTGAGAFAVIAVLAFLLNRERPRPFWAHLALLSFVEFTICGLGLAMGVQNLGGYHYGLLFMADGLTMLAAAEVLALLAESVRAPGRGRPARRRCRFTMDRYDAGGDPSIGDCPDVGWRQ